jgi:polar amino acid transport system ATP-binding protein
MPRIEHSAKGVYMSNYNYILKTEHLCKSFDSLEVLKDVNLEVKKGEVVCI